jgi:hypothetical protein
MQHDCFAREILGILECDPSRSRRLMRNTFGGWPKSPYFKNATADRSQVARLY